MCNLYNVTTTREAVRALTGAMDRSGWNEPSRDVYPGMLAPIVRAGQDGVREMIMATWGMPTPPAYIRGRYDPGVTNIRNVKSPHWRRWLAPANRCVVPFTRFAEPDPARREGDRNAWFAAREIGRLLFFAGIWTPWRGVRRVRDGEQDYELFGILTCEPNALVAAVHPKAMPVILHNRSEIELWLSASWPEACQLQRPLADDLLVRLPPPAAGSTNEQMRLL